MIPRIAFATIAAMRGRIQQHQQRQRLQLAAFALLGMMLVALTCLRPAHAENIQPAIIDSVSSASDDAASTQIEGDGLQIKTIDLTVPPDDLWQRLRNGFAMPNLASPLVADRQAWYLNRPELLKVMFERSRRYLYYIVSELEARGMPTELALLPMVESSYNPRAYSSAQALGIWQFIPSTGKHYGLEQNWYLDERRDIIASTNAALDYLQYIYEMHGDWHLALASYNWGEQAVGRAVARNAALNLPTDYQHLNMPGETRYYVPKLQALKNIIADPELFGIKLDPIPNQPYFGTVERPATMDVATAAKLAEIPIDEFIALNPAYSRPIMPGTSGSPIVLPADKIAVFQSNLQRQEDSAKPLCLWRTHTLKKGERLDRIAAKSGISLARLKQLNGFTPRTKTYAGMNILVPESAEVGNSVYLLSALPSTPSLDPRTAPIKRMKRGAAGKKMHRAGAKHTAKARAKKRH